MKVKFIKSYVAKIVEYLANLNVRVQITDNYNVVSYIDVPYADISSFRDGRPLPEFMLGADRRILVNTPFDIVGLTLEGGALRYALNEKSEMYNSRDLTSAEDESEDIVQLKKDMSDGETDQVEIKSSFTHPANPEDASDHSYQVREIIKQIQAIALSSVHKGRIWVGVRDSNGFRTVVGIENEFAEYAPGCDAEKFMSMFYNQLKQLTSTELMMATRLRYITYHGHTVARIDVDYKGDIVFYKGRELNVRVGTAMHTVEESSAYISFIRNYRNNQ